MRRIHTLLIALSLLALLAACAPPPAPAVSTPPESRGAAVETATPEPTAEPATPEPATQPAPTATAPAEDEDARAENAGQIVAQVLRQQLGLGIDQVTIVSVTPMEWSDSCLGLGGPAESCLAAITPGYEVVLEANGERYTYRTDLEAMDIRLAEAPTAQVGDPVLEWTGQGSDGGCRTAQIGTEGVAFGGCGSLLMQGRLIAEMERQAELAEFASTYAPFEAQTPAGGVTFAGQGDREATTAEQRMIAEWARLVSIEAAGGRSGASYGLLLAWHREGGVAGFCDDLTVYVTGTVYASACGGQQAQDLGQTRLGGEALAQVFDWVDRFAPFEYEHKDPAVADAMTVRMVFSGAGEEQATPEAQRAIVDFAAELYAAVGE